MNTLISKVRFTVHRPVEFIFAMNFTANDEELYKFFQEFNFSPDTEFKETIEIFKSKLSRFTEVELKYFFNWTQIKHVLGRIAVENRDINSVTQFIGLVEGFNDENLRKYIISQMLYDTSKGEAINISEIGSNELGNIIETIGIKDSSIKEKFIECIDNPSETKERLCLLMRQFYDKAYKPLEEGIIEKLHCQKTRYENLIKSSPEHFYKEYLNRYTDIEDLNFIIHISYFAQVRPWLFYIKPKDNIEWINIGIYTERYPIKTIKRDKVQKFLKILSDKKRFEMIELLAKRPWYGYELAAELNLTPPTVSYHMNTFLDLNLVYFEREENKTFYSLNKEKLIELSKDIAKVLLNEE